MKAKTLYLAFELSNKKWKLGFSTGDNFRIKSIDAGDLSALEVELRKTREKWSLDADTPVRSVYEAGRDGFWLHRYLSSKGVENVVVDPASIEVNRRKRRSKTDRLDVKSLLKQLMRYHGGESKVWSVVRVPDEAEEDARRCGREIKRLKKEMGAGSARMKSLLALHGIKIKRVTKLPSQLKVLRQWNGEALPPRITGELLREYERYEFARQQLKDLEKDRDRRVAEARTKAERLAYKLSGVRAIGTPSAMVLSEEFFSWREFRNVREVGACAGLTGSPYDSGDSNIEQGISKAGSARVRTLMIELAWSWLRLQPTSELSKWFRERFGRTRRSRRIGIVALARKLLVAFWKYLFTDELPAGAILKPRAA